MRNRLGMDITDIFARSILSGETFGKLDSYRNDYEETSWEYVAEYEYISHITGSRSSIYLYLDTELVDELTSRRPARPCRACPAIPSITSSTCRYASIAWWPRRRCRWHRCSPCSSTTSSCCARWTVTKCASTSRSSFAAPSSKRMAPCSSLHLKA